MTYAVVLQGSLKEERKQTKIDSNQHQSVVHTNKNNYRRNIIPIRTLPNRYQPLFYGHCFSCHNLGHKASTCNSYRRTSHKSAQGYDHKIINPSRNKKGRNYNTFSYVEYNINCYNCNNCGHMGIDSRLFREPIKTKLSDIQKENRNIWREKQIKGKNPKCKVELYAKNKKNQWYVDNGCSKHMTRDLNKFIILEKKEKGNVTYGGDGSAKILGRGNISLGNIKAKAENTLLVESLKHNLLSVIQTYYKGNILIFDS